MDVHVIQMVGRREAFEINVLGVAAPYSQVGISGCGC